LLLILAACVKYLYLNPLEKVLAERSRLTEGAQKAAENSFKSADSKIAEYEDALAKARAEIYAGQAEFLRQLHDQQSERTKAARTAAEHRLSLAKDSIAEESLAARESLQAESDALASRIAEAILNRSAA
jgi:F0F1-type ATP synthase membrane subunit b/b'